MQKNLMVLNVMLGIFLAFSTPSIWGMDDSDNDSVEEAVRLPSTSVFTIPANIVENCILETIQAQRLQNQLSQQGLDPWGQTGSNLLNGFTINFGGSLGKISAQLLATGGVLLYQKCRTLDPAIAKKEKNRNDMMERIENKKRALDLEQAHVLELQILTVRMTEKQNALSLLRQQAAGILPILAEEDREEIESGLNEKRLINFLTDYKMFDQLTSQEQVGQMESMPLDRKILKLEEKIKDKEYLKQLMTQKKPEYSSRRRANSPVAPMELSGQGSPAH